jgi:GNAT superfamily N-acetyltransferase
MFALFCILLSKTWYINENKSELDMINHTFKELMAIVNPGNEHHPESAYQMSLSEMNRRSWKKPLPECEISVVKHFSAKGIDFDMYEEKVDRWKLDYAKKDELGGLVKEADGRVVFLTMEEKAQKIKPRYSFEHFVVDRQSDMLVADTSDEWGCLLIAVAKEYQRMGIGSVLLEQEVATNPFRHTGGFTTDGQATYFKAFQKAVSKHMASGGFSRDVVDGKITTQRAMDIIASAEITRELILQKRFECVSDGASPEWARKMTPDYKRVSKLERADDFDFSRGKVLLYHTGSSVILMHEKALDLFTASSPDNEFREKAILGYAYLGGTYEGHETPKIFGLFGQNEKLEQMMIEIMLNINSNAPVRVNKEQLKTIQSMPEVMKNMSVGAKGSEFTDVTLEKRTMTDINKLAFSSNVVFRQKDPFEESLNIIHETASQIAEDVRLNKLQSSKELAI